MRKIALDVGDKTVGIAISDPLNITAQGLMTLERVGIRKDTGKQKFGRFRQHSNRKGI